VNPNATVVIAIIGGFFVTSFLAREYSTIINALLLLILIGVVLSNADRWLPYLTGLGNAQLTRPSTTSGTGATGSTRVGGIGGT
jgi:hypothetical protein